VLALRYLILAVQMIVSTAHANWFSLENTSHFSSYMDKSSISRKDSVVTTVELKDYNQPQIIYGMPVRIVKSERQYDCASRTARTLSFYLYAEGMVTGQTLLKDRDPSTWAPISKNSAEEKAFSIVCQRSR